MYMHWENVDNPFRFTQKALNQQKK
ncbi:hypothetical protein [Siminovitchia fortis]